MTPLRFRRQKKTDFPVQIFFDRSVFSYIVTELQKHPETEDGGKYVGYVISASDSRLREVDAKADTPAIVITDFLPGGPKALRTAVEFVPDGEFQETLFRRLEQLEPAIEHVGTWHSHHCNGLSTLSSGDIEGYRRTVNRQEYRLNFFLASLVKHVPRDPSDRSWIDHFIFTRGKDEWYCVNESIRIIDWPSTFTAHTMHSAVVRTCTPKEARVNDNKSVDKEIGTSWYETEIGRCTLSEDKWFFTNTFGGNVTATKRGHMITLTGRRGRASIAVTYPGTTKERDVTVTLREDERDILKTTCDLRYRTLAIKSVLIAYDSRGADNCPVPL